MVIDEPVHSNFWINFAYSVFECDCAKTIDKALLPGVKIYFHWT